MMELYSLPVSKNEILALRQSLDSINISGKDAKFVAQLQIKLENAVSQIDSIQQSIEQEKIQQLAESSKEVLK